MSLEKKLAGLLDRFKAGLTVSCAAYSLSVGLALGIGFYGCGKGGDEHIGSGAVCGEKTFGGTGNDVASSIQQTSDGGYIVAGSTYSKGAGGRDAWVLKLNQDLNLVLDKTYGKDNLDEIFSIQQTSDGEYIAAGSAAPPLKENINYTNAWVLKLDSAGNLIWDKTFGGSKGGEEIDEAYSAQETSDGGYVVAGFITAVNNISWDKDAWILKLDSAGNSIFEKTYNRSTFNQFKSDDRAYAVQQTSDGGYIVAGETDSQLKNSSSLDVWILKLDSAGNLIWDKTFGASGVAMDDGAFSIQQTTDGGYIVAGRAELTKADDSDVWILKLAQDGSLVWDKSYGGSDWWDQANSVQQTSEEGYIVAGSTNSKGAGGWDAWVLKLDSAGNLIWDKTFGGNEDDMAGSVRQTSDGGYIVAGRKEKEYNVDVWILKLDENGNLGCK